VTVLWRLLRRTPSMPGSNWQCGSLHRGLCGCAQHQFEGWDCYCVNSSSFVELHKGFRGSQRRGCCAGVEWRWGWVRVV
jgi:hypothetical protein